MYQLQFEELKARAQHGSAQTSDQRRGNGQVQSLIFFPEVAPNEAKRMKVLTGRSSSILLSPSEFQSNVPAGSVRSLAGKKRVSKEG